MQIRCRQCGANNHWQNRLCLACGADLTESREPAAARPASPTPPPPQALPQPPTGESSDAPSIESIRSLSYLFQEEPRASHAGRYFLLVLLFLGVAAAGWRWRDLRALADRFSTPAVGPSQAANPSPPPASVSPSEAPTPQNAEPAPPDLTPKLDQTAAEKSANEPPEESTDHSPKARIQPASENTRIANTWETEGEKYLYGDGVPVNCDRAQKDLLAAAKHSSAKAQQALGTMYATGHCAIRDLPLAYRWFARAQRQDPRGNHKLAEDMKVLWNQMSPEERKLATQ